MHAVLFGSEQGEYLAMRFEQPEPEKQGWIEAEWRDSELGRSAKFYSLTREGNKQLQSELRTWTRLSSAVALVIQRA